MYFRTDDNIDLYYHTCGNGVPCIFIHGGPGGWSKDFELTCGKHLELKLKMIYLDQRGCGRSGGSKEDDYSIGRIVRDIEELRKSLNVDKMIIIAHSFGGVIATDYASKHQNNLLGLILLNATLNINDSFNAIVEKGCELLNLDADEFDKIKGEKLDDFLTKLVESDLHYILQCKEKSTYEYMSELMKDIINSNMAIQRENNESYYNNYYEVSKEIDIRTLVVVGNEDYSVGINHHNNFNFKNSTVKVIEGKHVPYIEDSQIVTNCIFEFVDQIN